MGIDLSIILNSAWDLDEYRIPSLAHRHRMDSDIPPRHSQLSQTRDIERIIFPAHLKDTIIELFNRPIPSHERCRICGAMKSPIIVLNKLIMTQMCVSCGFPEDTVDEWMAGFGILVAYLCTRVGVLRLNKLALRWPKFMIEDYIMTPTEIDLARGELAHQLGSNSLPKVLSMVQIGNQLQMLESAHYRSPYSTLLLPRVHNVAGVISFPSLWYKGIEFTPYFIEPRVGSVIAKYHPVTKFVNRVAKEWDMVVNKESTDTRELHYVPKSSNQFFTKPFSRIPINVTWTWDLQGTKLTLRCSDGTLILPSKTFVNGMSFVNPTSKWHIIRAPSKMTSVTYNDAKRAKASITVEGTIVYKGGYKQYAKCMMGLITLIRDSLLQMDRHTLCTFRVLKKDATWQGGVKRSVEEVEMLG